MTAAITPNAAHGMGKSAWLTFAGLLVCVIGFLNIIDGLTALSKRNYFLVTENHILVFNFAAWGVIWLVVGIIQLVVGGFIMARAKWARIAGIVMVVLAIIGQLAFLNAFPWWSIICIGLGALALYALIVPPSESVAL